MIRRALLALCTVLVLCTWKAQAQHDSSYRALFRIYEDNDFMNIWANGTDKAYSNGTRFDIFYTKRHPSRFFIDRWMPSAGDNTIDVFSWGLMQTMITPYDLSKRIPDKKDWPYSGGLFALHTKHSSNPVKLYSLQTELIMGVMGPSSLARQAQESIHKLVHFTRPKGWAYQLPTDVLFNVNVTAEKMIAHNANKVEFIGGAKVYAGTALNGGALYTLLRFGKMSPYFNGWLSQYTGAPWQWYFFMKPEVEFLATNALIDGGVFSNPNRHNRNLFAGKLNYGIVLARRRYSVSFSQTGSTRLKSTVKAHGIGNISLHIAW